MYNNHNDNLAAPVYTQSWQTIVFKKAEIYLFLDWFSVTTQEQVQAEDSIQTLRKASGEN